MTNSSSHGNVSDGFSGFVRLLDAQPVQPTVEALQALAKVMVDNLDDPSDQPDPEENLMVPAGYTYFGQFVDHDLTFDIGTSFQDSDPAAFRNARSPRFDLDNIYGPGPDAAPFMYEADGVHLRVGTNDLPRVVTGRDQAGNNLLGRAIIGDPRNDENSIVCNLQMRFIAFHNAVADRLAAQDPSLTRPDQGSTWFKRAQQEVRWTYQVILVRDFLRRIVKASVLDDFDGVRQPDGKDLSTRDGAFKLYPPDKRTAIPLEFAGAAYRYGHSAVRFGYRLSDTALLPIFSLSTDPTVQNNPANSLVGFAPLPPSHVITKWDRFFPAPTSGHACVVPGTADPAKTPADGSSDASRLQFSYRIDTTIVDPLSNLPPSIAGTGPANLAERNLRRGRVYQLPTGQQAASALGKPSLPAGAIRVRTKLRKVAVAGSNDTQWVETFFTPQQALAQLQAGSKTASVNVDLDQFLTATPLWFYVLAEAQQKIFNWWLARGASGVEFTEDELIDSGDVTVAQLGDVGGRIVAEVFHGLLDADPDSYRNSDGGQAWLQGGHLIQDFTMWHLVNAALKP